MGRYRQAWRPRTTFRRTPVWRWWPAALLSAEHLLGDGGQLHIRGAFVDLSDLGVAIVFFGGIVADKSISAEDLHRQARCLLGHLRGKELCHGCLAHIGLAKVL